jgi:hypothetical protein
MSFFLARLPTESSLIVRLAVPVALSSDPTAGFFEQDTKIVIPETNMRNIPFMLISF